MSLIYNRRTTGFFDNGNASDPTGDAMGYSIALGKGINGSNAFDMNVNRYGDGVLSGNYIPVDTSKIYHLSATIRTYELSYNNRLGSGHIGYASYDENFQFISHRDSTGYGQTTLTRPANPGDTTVYIADSTSWYVGTVSSFWWISFFPATHPKFSDPYKLSRLWVSYDSTSPAVWTGSDYAINLHSPLPDWGYPLPAGTPVHNSRDGGSFNYALGAPDYPETWTTFSVLCTGEGAGSGSTFRWQTKYIRWLNLCNYNYRFEQSGPSAKYYIDNITFVERPNGTKLPNYFLESGRLR